jgi:ABC-type branched-subunit amino acid transport system ATPase component
VCLIENGAIKHEGRSSDLKNDPSVRLRYLGV